MFNNLFQRARFDPVTLDQAAGKLLEFTSQADIFRDKQDIVYLTQVNMFMISPSHIEGHSYVLIYYSLWPMGIIILYLYFEVFIDHKTTFESSNGALTALRDATL